MNYKTRLNRVIDYIGTHLDSELTLDELCKVACCSKYHFHRLFTAYTGLSLQAYIKWIRLKKAAHQLIMQKEDTIINIALDTGFQSHEAFSRAFKQICGQSPSGFRRQANWQAWVNPPYSLHLEGKKTMHVTIKEQSTRKLAVIEHHGDPMKSLDTVDKLITWAKSQSIGNPPTRATASKFYTRKIFTIFRVKI